MGSDFAQRFEVGERLLETRTQWHYGNPGEPIGSALIFIRTDGNVVYGMVEPTHPAYDIGLERAAPCLLCYTPEATASIDEMLAESRNRDYDVIELRVSVFPHGLASDWGDVVSGVAAAYCAAWGDHHLPRSVTK
ncbi:hypothetical protein HY493_05625 [Candidatus Woesearchaeota archaeon]|nr:hypothetical protein [Candidatus Woesearchaeota archaeon]